MTIGDNVRRYRKLRGLTQRELAVLAETTQFTISGLETDAHKPHDRTVRRLAGALRVTVPDLYEGVDLDAPKEEAPSQLESRRRERRSQRSEKVRLGDVVGDERIQQAHEEINRLFEERKAETISAEEYQEQIIRLWNDLFDAAERASKDAG